jgi:hypothetical protein
MHLCNCWVEAVFKVGALEDLREIAVMQQFNSAKEKRKPWFANFT